MIFNYGQGWVCCIIHSNELRRKKKFTLPEEESYVQSGLWDQEVDWNGRINLKP